MVMDEFGANLIKSQQKTTTATAALFTLDKQIITIAQISTMFRCCSLKTSSSANKLDSSLYKPLFSSLINVPTC